MSKTLETKFEAWSKFFYSSYIKTQPEVFNDNADTLLTLRGVGNVKNKKGKKMKRKNLLGTVGMYFCYGEITAEILLHVTGN